MCMHVLLRLSCVCVCGSVMNKLITGPAAKLLNLIGLRVIGLAMHTSVVLQCIISEYIMGLRAIVMGYSAKGY